jgi:hypothetical protein
LLSAAVCCYLLLSVAVCCSLFLSVAVSQHKCIWIGYIEKVNCTGTKAVIVCMLEITIWIKCTCKFFWKRHEIMPFPTWREQAGIWEHSDGIKDKLQKMRNLPFSYNQFICYIA